MSNDNFTCETSVDCEKVTNPGVVKVCYASASFTDETFFCECSNWYQWVGEDCDESSIGVIVFRISSYLICILSAFVIITSGRTFLLNCTIAKNPSEGVDPVFYTTIFVFLSASFIFIMTILNSIAATDPTFFQLDNFNSFLLGAQAEAISPKFGVLSSSFGALSVLFFGFSALTITLSWRRITSKLQRFNSINLSNKKNKLTFFMLTGISLYCLIFLILLSMKYIAATGIMAFFLGVFVFIGYITYGSKFIKTLDNFSYSNSKSIQLTIKMVKKSYKFYAIATFFVSIGILGYSIAAFYYEENTDLGTINYLQLIRDLITIATLSMLTHSSWYVNSFTDGPTLINESNPCTTIFQCWDAQNLKLAESALIESTSTYKE